MSMSDQTTKQLKVVPGGASPDPNVALERVSLYDAAGAPISIGGGGGGGGGAKLLYARTWQNDNSAIPWTIPAASMAVMNDPAILGSLGMTEYVGEGVTQDYNGANNIRITTSSDEPVYVITSVYAAGAIGSNILELKIDHHGYIAQSKEPMDGSGGIPMFTCPCVFKPGPVQLLSSMRNNNATTYTVGYYELNVVQFSLS